MIGRVKFTVMNEKELSHMKDRMEQLLIERGVVVDHEELLQELEKKGCKVDYETKELKFTRETIDRAVAALPKEFTLFSPSGKYDMVYPNPSGDFYTRTCTGAPNYMDINGDVHYFKKEEVDEFYKVCNALDDIDFVTMPSTSGEYVPEKAVDVWTLAQGLKKSAKHIWVQPYESDNVQYLIDVAAAAVGGYEELKKRPVVSMISCSVPCLSFKHMDAEILLKSAQYFIPVQPCSLPTAGANTPVTAVGTAFVACAEVMAQIIILELLAPGLPVIATPLLFSMDMQSTYTLQSNTEITIARLISMELFENGYGIPAHTYGTGTDSLSLDAQNFIERTNLTDELALSAATVLGGAGQLETAKTISPVQLIIDNEIFAIARRERRGLAVDDETIDWDELIAGLDKDPSFTYLMSEHTMRHFTEPHRPDMFNRDGRVQWERGGKKDLVAKAEEKFHQIMDGDDLYQVSPETEAAIDAARDKGIKALMGE